MRYKMKDLVRTHGKPFFDLERYLITFGKRNNS